MPGVELHHSSNPKNVYLPFVAVKSLVKIK